MGGADEEDVRWWGGLYDHVPPRRDSLWLLYNVNAPQAFHRTDTGLALLIQAKTNT